jgi:hypothetical protein
VAQDRSTSLPSARSRPSGGSLPSDRPRRPAKRPRVDHAYGLIRPPRSDLQVRRLSVSSFFDTIFYEPRGSCNFHPGPNPNHGRSVQVDQAKSVHTTSACSFRHTCCITQGRSGSVSAPARPGATQYMAILHRGTSSVPRGQGNEHHPESCHAGSCGSSQFDGSSHQIDFSMPGPDRQRPNQLRLVT